MKKIILTVVVALLGVCVVHAVELDRKGRDAEYVASIVGRARKIVDKLGIEDAPRAESVTNIIANRYFKLNDIYAVRDSVVRVAKEDLQGDERKAVQASAEQAKDSELYRTRFGFLADLSLFLSDEQVTAVKDGMTFGVLGVTYTATLDMVPTLTEEEKRQIMVWLVEAREYAMDAETSKKKHEVFGRYKGRINNYLSGRGYDLVKERESWYERIRARGGTI